MISDETQKPSPISSNTLSDPFEPTKRKVVKRQLPQQLKKKLKRDDEDLPDWKPQKLSDIPQPQAPKQSQSSIGLSFLSSLSKPQNNEISRPFIPTSSKNRTSIKPVIDISNPTQQQIKFDIQDSTFIVKELINQAKRGKQQEPEDLIPVPEEYQGEDIKQINREELVDVNWQQKLREKQMKLSMVDELKNSLGQLNKNNNDINFLVDEALRRNEIEEYDITQKADSMKRKKQRYGW